MMQITDRQKLLFLLVVVGPIPLVLFLYNRFGIWYDWFAFVPLVSLTVPALVFKARDFIINRTISEHRRRAIEISSTAPSPQPRTHDHSPGGNHDDNDATRG